MKPRPHLLRWTAALFAVLFAVAPVAAGLHSDDHAHVYCPEHQAIEESGGDGAVVSLVAPMAWTEGAESSAEEHESCPFLALSVRSALPSASSVSREVLAERDVVRAVRAVRGFDVVTVLDRAPKSSPPEAPL